MAEIRMLNIDCMEFMKDKPNKAYELAIVDPPYGIGGGFKHNYESYMGF
jgi:site-specific DNA-methyltransferase (adenine-specific)